MTHDHDDTPHAIFNTISGTCWKVSEFIDFDLKNRIKLVKNKFLKIYAFISYWYNVLSKLKKI